MVVPSIISRYAVRGIKATETAAAPTAQFGSKGVSQSSTAETVMVPIDVSSCTHTSTRPQVRESSHDAAGNTPRHTPQATKSESTPRIDLQPTVKPHSLHPRSKGQSHSTTSTPSVPLGVGSFGGMGSCGGSVSCSVGNPL